MHTDFETLMGMVDQVVIEERIEDYNKQQQNHISNYIQSLAAIEGEMQIFKDQKKDLKESYIENGWLTKEDMSLALKAYRLAKSVRDIDALMDLVDALRQKGIQAE